MSETILLRLTGGPRAGQNFVPLVLFGQWPLPETLYGETYKKINESKLTAAQANHPNVMRGVEYKWVEGQADE